MDRSHQMPDYNNRYDGRGDLRRPMPTGGPENFQIGNRPRRDQLRRPMTEGWSSEPVNEYYVQSQESRPTYSSIAAGYPSPHMQMQMPAPMQPQIQQMQPQMQPQLQPQLQQHQFVLSANAAEFIPQFPTAFNPQFIPPQMFAAQEPIVANDLEMHPATIELRQALFTLTINPGKFHSRVPALTSNLNSTIKDEYQFRNIIEIIFDQSIVEPNFRYTGARLCDFLQKNLTLNMPEGNFRSYLLNRCKNEYEHQISNKEGRNKEEKMRLQGFTMFMAELFTNMEIEVEGTKSKVDAIGKVLPDLIMALAYSQNDDLNFKCLCQVVKLSGASLEEFEKSNGNGETPKMNKLFDIIQKHSKSDELKSITKEMLTKVIELRKTDWGKNSPSSTSEINIEALHISNDGTVFYGPDGLPLSNEETQFLQNNQPSESFSSECNDPYTSEAEDTGMDDEMYDAYEQFLAECNN